MNFGKKLNIIRKHSRVALIFEGFEENLLFNQAIFKIFKNDVSVLHINGTDINFFNDFKERIRRIPRKIFVVDNDEGGEQIKKMINKSKVKNFEVLNIQDIFNSKAKNMELLLIENDLYPKWLLPFFDKDIIFEKYRSDNEERSKKEILEKVEEFKNLIVPNKDDDFEPIISSYFNWCEYRLLDNKLCNNKVINTYRNLVFCLFANHLVFLKKVKFKLPKKIKSTIHEKDLFKSLEMILRRELLNK